MSAHITHEEMTELLVGARTSTLDCHLQACAECREEFARVKSSLESFRVASHAWSTSKTGETRQAIAFSRKPSYAWGRLAAVAAVLLTVFAAAYRIEKSPSIENTVRQDQIAQDNELLAQVDSEISESVPTPMQPLQISAESSESSSQNTK